MPPEHPARARPDGFPDFKSHPEIWDVVRGVGTGAVPVDEGVERLRAIMNGYLPERASDGHAAAVGIHVTERSVRPDLAPVHPSVVRRWNELASEEPYDRAAYRAAWYLVGYMTLLRPDEHVKAGGRLLYDRLMEIAPKQIVIE
jgi:hypothetical protein